MSDYKPQEGDRVRVVLEGDVTRTSDAYGGYYTIDGNTEVFNEDKSVVSVEKIEPPVEVFQPGDVVRAFHEGPDDFYIIGKEGYLELPSGNFYADGPDAYKSSTSDYYEKVSLG